MLDTFYISWLCHVLDLHRVLAFTETGVGERDAVGRFAPDLTFMEMDIVHGMTAR